MPDEYINSEGEQLSAAALAPTLDVEQNPNNANANHIEVHRAVPLFLGTETYSSDDLFPQPLQEFQEQRADRAPLTTDGQPVYKQRLFWIRLLFVVVAAAIGGYIFLSFILEDTREPDASQVAALVALYESTNGASWKLFNKKNNWLSAEPVCKWNGVTCKGVSITEVLLSDVSLQGSIPSEIGHLKQLERLDLSSNTITGSLPNTLGNLRNLKYLSLPWNRISGSIPSTLGNLNNLQLMDLEKNSISGTIPSTLGDLSKLFAMHLNHNRITGTIPSDLGRLSNLYTLKVFYTDLTGSIPTTLGIYMGKLHLKGNNLSGMIPSTLGNLNSKLYYIDLVDNSLTGMIPTELGRLSSLSHLYVSGNDLTGTMPNEICMLQTTYGCASPYLGVDCEEVECPCCWLCCVDRCGDDCI
mmetsp:Transcript_695/g.1099  ORF Transcript_695/g.1099 Transcript_695/m.1099 type:complete len:413 (-) Transcript_695:118-1356(-)